MKRLLAPMTIVALSFLGGPVTGDGGGDPEWSSREAALSRTLARAADRAAPWVVSIHPAGEGEEIERRTRSGVVIAPETVITCATNVDVFGVDDLVVEAGEGAPLPARLRGRDLRLRLVMLEVPGLRAGPAPLSPGPHPAGTFALALGTPLGGGPTVTFGIVSATGRFQGRAYQTDAAQDGSNTGGALVDLEGRLIGVLVHVHERLGDRSGVGFAIPASRILPVLEPLRDGMQLEPGKLGLIVPRFDDPRAQGVSVKGVVPGGAAAAAGLRAEDRILSIDGLPTDTRDALGEVTADLYAGQEVVVVFSRDGVERRLTVTVEPIQK